MKSYLSLIPISAQVRRKQNQMTLICIILSVFLVTAVFSMADVWFNGETQAMIKRHGNHHIILHDVTEETARQISLRDDVITTAWCARINEKLDKTYFIEDKSAILFGTEQSYLSEIRNFPVEGSLPQHEDEVMLNKGARELLNVTIGDRIMLNTSQGDLEYTVSGFCDDYDYDYLKNSGVVLYLNKTEFYGIYGLCGDEVRGEYYIRFGENVQMRNVIEEIKGQYGLTDEQVEENMVTLGAAGASSDGRIKNIYALAGTVFLLVLIAGILMISSCMNSNIAQRTEFFGMMRCIGASREQIIRFVRLEALNWCKTAVPAGCGLGVFVSWVLCFILGHLVKGEFAEFTFRFSLIGIVSGVTVGIVTVLLAAHSPARRAAEVSPVTAVSGNAGAAERIPHAADTRLFRVETALGINHAVISRKNLILMTLSFALTIILFFAFSGFLDFAKKLLPSMSNFSPDVSIVSVDAANSMGAELVKQISDVPGVEEVFGTAFSYDTPAQINGREGSIDLISYNEYLLDNSRKSVVSGDIDKVYGGSDYALVIYTRESRLDTGDIIKVGDTQLEVACVVSEGVGSTDARPSVCCSEETYRRITGENGYVLINAILSKDATEQAIDQIAVLAGENEMEDRRAEDQESNQSFWVFRLAAYGFLIIIAFITILNIMNSISMSVSARIRQYGAMRAVGMSVKQLARMIAAEALTYAGCGSLVGCVCGLLLHRLISVKLIYEHFGGNWSIPVMPVVLILLLVLASCVAAVYAPYKRIRGLSITDTIQAQ